MPGTSGPAGRAHPAGPPAPVASRGIVRIVAAVLLSFLAVGAVLPALPRLVTGPLGAGGLAVGIVIGAPALTSIAGRPVAGRLSDGLGRRRTMLGAAVLVAVAGGLLLAPLDLAGVVAARLLLGVGTGALFVAGAAWVVDLAPARRRGQIVGLFGLAVWGGLSVGPLIGELLLWAGGYRAVWAAAAALPLGALPLLARSGGGAARAAAGAGPAPLLSRAALAPGAAMGLASVGYVTLSAFVVLLLDDRGVGNGAPVFALFAAAVVGSRLLVGWVPDRLGARRSAVAAGLAEAAGLALIAVAPAWGVAAAGAVVMGAGFSLMYPALALVVVDRVDGSRRGAALGTFTAFFDVGVVLGAPLVGAVAAAAGYEAGFLVAAGLAATAAAVAGVSAAADRSPGRDRWRIRATRRKDHPARGGPS